MFILLYIIIIIIIMTTIIILILLIIIIIIIVIIILYCRPSPPGSISERSSGDGGSDCEAAHYATVGRRVRSEAIYSSMRRPDGEADYDPYSSIRSTREEVLYETLQKYEPAECMVSSEASSVSQDTVMQADITELYARVDINKKKKRNSDSSASPVTETPVPVPAPRRIIGDRGRQEEAEGT